MLRTRTCTDPAPQYGGQQCSGSDRQTQNCTVHCPIDGAWATWSSWGSCSATCGNGTMLRTRTCSDPAPQYGGQECSGSGEQTQDCNNPAPEHDGQECSGSDTETENCTESHCSAPVCFDSYTMFNESYRRESVRGCDVGPTTECDADKVTGDSWYRFRLPTGENGVLDTCPERDTCGTCGPIWMRSSHPTQFGVIKDVTMAVSAGEGICSQLSGSGSVTKCSVNGEVFYLYRLWKPTGCFLSYCAATYSLGED